jgi:ankyrin repeat protein
MEIQSQFPIGIHDIDREILYHVSDKVLFNVCVTNKYMQQVCNESFWRNKFIGRFETDLGKYANEPYINLYKKLNLLSDEELLKISAKKGYLPLIKLLVKESIITFYENEALRDTIHLHVAKYYIEKKNHDILNFDPWGGKFYADIDYTAIIAVENGNLDIIKYFVECGINFFENNNNIFIHAIYNGDLNVIKYLIKYINLSKHYDKLEECISRGPLDIIKYFIKDTKGAPWCGMDINVCSELFSSVAAKKGHLDVIQYFLDNDADFYVYTPIYNAAKHGHLNIVKYLINSGADIHVDDDELLSISAKKGHLNVVKYLVENGANIHEYEYNDEDGALCNAVENGHLDVVKYLIESKLYIITNYDIRKILVKAIKNNQLNVAQYFMEMWKNTN